MADQIILSNGVPGLTVYALIRKPDGTIWNGAAFVTEVGASYGSYDIPLTDADGVGNYKAAFPAAITAGFYLEEARLQVGGSPDGTTDPVIGGDSRQWSGGSSHPADAVLSRNPATTRAVVASLPQRCIINANARLVNKNENVNNVLAVYAEDDTTLAYSINLSGAAAAAPTASDPN